MATTKKITGIKSLIKCLESTYIEMDHRIPLYLGLEELLQRKSLFSYDLFDEIEHLCSQTEVIIRSFTKLAKINRPLIQPKVEEMLKQTLEKTQELLLISDQEHIDFIKATYAETFESE